MIKLPLSVVRVVAFCLPLALVASCGSGSEAVQGTVIIIRPIALAQNTAPGVRASLVQELFTIELHSPTGYPQIDTQLLIETPGTLYVVDTSTTPWTYTVVPSSYTTTINSNGVFTVAVDFTSPPAATGDITVISAWSGTGYGRTNVTYTCKAVAPATC